LKAMRRRSTTTRSTTGSCRGARLIPKGVRPGREVTAVTDCRFGPSIADRLVSDPTDHSCGKRRRAAPSLLSSTDDGTLDQVERANTQGECLVIGEARPARRHRKRNLVLSVTGTRAGWAYSFYGPPSADRTRRSFGGDKAKPSVPPNRRLCCVLHDGARRRLLDGPGRW